MNESGTVIRILHVIILNTINDLSQSELRMLTYLFFTKSHLIFKIPIKKETAVFFI